MARAEITNLTKQELTESNSITPNNMEKRDVLQGPGKYTYITDLAVKTEALTERTPIKPLSGSPFPSIDSVWPAGD